MTITVADILGAAANRDMNEVEKRLYAFLDQRENTRGMLTEAEINVALAAINAKTRNLLHTQSNHTFITASEAIGELAQSLHVVMSANIDKDGEAFRDELEYIGAYAAHAHAASLKDVP